MGDPTKTYAARREYLLNRYHERMQMAIRILGGKCVECGTVEQLEIDHIDRKSKRFNMGQVYCRRESVFLTEIAKCQLLCNEHHVAKTLAERGQLPARGTHGTFNSYRYCHCEICRAAVREAGRRNTAAYRARKRARSQVVKASVL